MKVAPAIMFMKSHHTFIGKYKNDLKRDFCPNVYCIIGGVVTNLQHAAQAAVLIFLIGTFHISGHFETHIILR